MHNKRTVITEVVAADLCCGCGVCVATCPGNALRMVWARNGDRVAAAVEGSECLEGCCLCLAVCPFSNQGPDESTIGDHRFADLPMIDWHELVGYYRSSFVGYTTDSERREQSASGGLCTALCQALLSDQEVDLIACATSQASDGRICVYEAVSEVENLTRAAGTRYYPADLADVIREILHGPPRRSAVVGLPCALKGVSRAMQIVPRLRERIAFLIGVACGHMPNRYYTEYLARISGVLPSELVGAEYRLKSGTRADRYAFRATGQRRGPGRVVPFDRRISWAWTSGLFGMRACDFCDDIFAEVADICFMDAWLPKYASDPKGHSLCLVRHPEIERALAQRIESGEYQLDPIELADVINSQSGVITKKRKTIGLRLRYANLHNERVQVKRTESSTELSLSDRILIWSSNALRDSSKSLWPSVRERPLIIFHFLIYWIGLPLRARLWIHRARRLELEVRRSIRTVLRKGNSSAQILP